ncbi:hypothetical protein PZA11_005570 [Diplocarpon coronariae]
MSKAPSKSVFVGNIPYVCTSRIPAPTSNSNQHAIERLRRTSAPARASPSHILDPPSPPRRRSPPNLNCPDAISRTLNTLPPAQLLDVLSQMKTLATTDAARATELLQQAPQLSYAIFQALLLMGLVSTEALSSVVEAASAPPPLDQGPRQSTQLSQGPPQYAQAPPPGNYPPGFPPPPQHMSGQLGIPMGTTSVQQHGQGYPPPAPQQQQRPQQQPAPLPSTEDLMAQVMAMPQSMVDQLPPAERAQIMALRAGYGR